MYIQYICIYIYIFRVFSCALLFVLRLSCRWASTVKWVVVLVNSGHVVNLCSTVVGSLTPCALWLGIQPFEAAKAHSDVNGHYDWHTVTWFW